MNEQIETIDGFVVDIACLRKYPVDDVLNKAKEHSKGCALMGHCIESGYGLVEENGIHLLDPKATEKVVQLLKNTSKEKGIKLQAKRINVEGEQQTIEVKEI